MNVITAENGNGIKPYEILQPADSQKKNHIVSTAVQSLQQQTLTRIEFYKRYNALVDLEEKLADEGKTLDSKDAIELTALVNLMKKDKTSILTTEEKVEISKDEYYFVQFNETNNKIKRLKEQIQDTLQIQNVIEMVKCCDTKPWYKNYVLRQTRSEYLDLLEVFKNSHRINIDIIGIVKKLEALQTDSVVSDIYPILKDLFSAFFKTYHFQQVFNNKCSNQALAMLKMYEKALDEQWLCEKILQQEEKIGAALINEQKAFKQAHEDTKALIMSTFKKIELELEKLTPLASYKAFIVGMDSTGNKTGRYLSSSATDRLIGTLKVQEVNQISRYLDKALEQTDKKPVNEIENGCSGYTVWTIERADIKLLTNMQQAFGALFHSMVLMESNWEVRMNLMNEKSKQSSAFTKGKDKDTTEISFLHERLNRIFYLHATCIQNRRHNIEIDKCFKKETELLAEKIPFMERGSKVLLRNSKSKKYLMCENPIVDESKEKQKNAVISFTDQANHERAVWDFIDERTGGISLRNAISKHYLTCSADSLVPDMKVVGNPLLNKQRTPSLIELFEGRWLLKKIQDQILEIERERLEMLKKTFT